MNSGLLALPSNQSPKTPTSNGLPGTSSRNLSPIPFNSFSSNPVASRCNMASSSKAPNPPPGFHKPMWDILIPKPADLATKSPDPRPSFQIKTKDNSSLKLQPQNPNLLGPCMQNDLFDLSFLQNFSFSPSLMSNSKHTPSLVKLRTPTTGPLNSDMTTTLPIIERKLYQSFSEKMTMLSHQTLELNRVPCMARRRNLADEPSQKATAPLRRLTRQALIEIENGRVWKKGHEWTPKEAQTNSIDTGYLKPIIEELNIDSW